MGVVYEAIQEGLGRHVALKVIRPELLADPGFLQRFRCEAQAAAHLHHPHIVPVFDAGTHDGVPYFAMQFISGQSLDAILREVKRLRGVKAGAQAAGEPDGPALRHVPADVTASNLAERLLTGRFDRRIPDEPTAPVPALEKPSPETERSNPPATPLGDQGQGGYYRVIARLGAQVAGAVGYAHKQGILHRDIKPSNLLIGLDGHVWVADFGLAKVVESDDASRSQDLAGTPRYMAPERFEGWSDRRSDVYALGVTLYEMATLSPAFPARDRAQLIHQILHEDPAHPRRLDRGIPRDLETIIRKAMAREPAERYRSADDLAEDLENFLAHRPIRARRNTLTERAWKWCRRKPALAGLWLVLALGLVGTSSQWWRAERSLNRTNRMAMGLALDRALAYCQQGEPARGMLQMVELLRSAPSSAPEYEHAIRANLTVWARRLPRPIAMRQLAAPLSQIHRRGFPQQVLALRSRIALVNTLRGVQVWDLERLEPRNRLLAEGQVTVSLALLPDEKCAVTIDNGGTVWRWDVATGEPLGPPITCRDKNPSSPARERPNGSLLSPTGTKAAIYADPFTLRFWDLKVGSPIGGPIKLGAILGGASFSPDEKTFVTFHGSYELWETATGRRLVSNSLPGGFGQLASETIAFRPDGKVVATGSATAPQGLALVHLLAADTGRPSGKPLIASDRVTSLCFSPNGRNLATVSVRGLSRLWEATTGKPMGEPFWHQPSNVSAFAASDKWYLTIERHKDPDSYLTKWKMPMDWAGEPMPNSILNAHASMAQNPDGSVVATGLNDTFVVLRDGASLKPTGPEIRHRDSVLALAISPDGTTLATGSADATAQLLEIGSGRLIGQSLAHRGPIRSVAFRGDGRVLATGSDDGTARLWDVATGTAIGPPLQHPGAVEVVAFDNEGSLLTRGRDQIVRRWAFPHAAEGDCDRVLFWVQALTGAELTPEGAIRRIPSESRSSRGDAELWDAIITAREQGVPPEP